MLLAADLPIPCSVDARRSAAAITARNGGSLGVRPGSFSTCLGEMRTRTLADGIAHRFALATDDVMLLTSAPVDSVEPSGPTRASLDRAIARRGILASAHKNVDDALSETCIGVDFCNGLYVTGNAKKLARLFQGLAYCIEVSPELSALEISALLGQETWIGLLNRPSLSCFHEIYGLTTTFPTCEGSSLRRCSTNWLLSCVSLRRLRTI